MASPIIAERKDFNALRDSFESCVKIALKVLSSRGFSKGLIFFCILFISITPYYVIARDMSFLYTFLRKKMKFSA